MHISVLHGGNFSANTYLITSEHNYTLIVDPNDASLIQTEIVRNRSIPVAILLTHGHFDHICALNELLERYSIPVYIHSADSELLIDPIKNGLHFFYPNAPFQPTTERVRLIHGGEKISFNGFDEPIQVLHTPGHTKGSVCYFFNDQNGNASLITGDVLFAGSIGRTDLYGGSSKEMIDSLHELCKLSDELVVYPGHGPATDIGSEKQSNPYLW